MRLPNSEHPIQRPASAPPTRWKMRRGITVAETITAGALFVLLLAGLVSLNSGAAAAWSIGSSQMMADNNASLALQKLTTEIRDGQSASVDTTGTRLTVTFPAITADGDYDRSGAGNTIVYFLSGTSLTRQQGTASAVLCKNVNSVQFAVSGGQVQVTLTSRQQNGTQARLTTLTSPVSLRNQPPS